MSKLNDALGQQSQTPETDSYFTQYGLLENPFPPNRTIVPEVLYKQEKAWERFLGLVTEIIKPQPARRAMAVLGGTGAGKTHFMRHCQWEFRTYCETHKRKFIIVEFQVGAGTVQDIVRTCLEAANTLSRSLNEEDFITAVARRIQEADSPQLILNKVRQEELKSALNHLVEAADPDFSPKDRFGYYTFELLREIANKWLIGGSITKTEQKYLGVFSRISTSSMAVRVMRELFSIARLLGLFEGALLCLDEVETLFIKGLRPAQYQAFLQDLRYLYDEAVKDDNGYSLLVISGSTQAGADLLRKENFPIYQRLGFESDSRVELRCP